MNTKEKLTHTELTNNLEQFYGTEHYYKPSMFSNIVITDGVKYFCDTCSCYWLLEESIISGLQALSNKYPFLLVEFKVTNKRGTTYIEAKEDTNAPLLLKKRTKDLCNLIPIGEYKFYLIDKVLLLPSEY